MTRQVNMQVTVDNTGAEQAGCWQQECNMGNLADWCPVYTKGWCIFPCGLASHLHENPVFFCCCFFITESQKWSFLITPVMCCHQ